MNDHCWFELFLYLNCEAFNAMKTLFRKTNRGTFTATLYSILEMKTLLETLKFK